MLGTVRASWLPMNAPASKANQLERRLISFGAAILALSGKLPTTPKGRHSCGQILRSGTAAAANYGERFGLKWLAKVAYFQRKQLSPLSRKTANCAELSRPRL